MTKKEKFQQYKENLLAKVIQFRRAYEELRDFFDSEEEFECNDFICEDYPFDKSFDEYCNITDWQYAIQEKLEEYEKELERDNK